MTHAWIAAAIFAATYVLISLQKIRFLNLDRPSAVLTGSVLMLLTGVLSVEQAYAAINLDTITLLLGTMIVVAYLREARFFEWVAAWIARRAGTPRRMLVLLILASAGLSALFTNDTVCVMFTPVVLAATLRAGLDPVPYLIALVTSANIGSALTLTGNPQNMLIGVTSNLSFARFLIFQAPVVAVALLIQTAILLRMYPLPAAFALPVEDGPAADRIVARRMLAVGAAMLAAFLLPLEDWIPGLDAGRKLALVAITAGTVAILVGRYRPAVAFRHVDWPLLLFFAGLFVVMAGVHHQGLLPALHRAVAPRLGESTGTQTVSLTALSIVASNLVSNVPFVMFARDWVAHMDHPVLMWHVLATASTFAGNLTIVGSVANIIVLELSRDQAPIGFWRYFRAGFPITVATSTAGALLLWLFARAGWMTY